jgi:predicted RNA-binding Zn-ribbon protein involved in translation (DUF1610 family)
MFNFFKKKKSRLSGFSKEDVELLKIRKEILRSTKNKHWKCPRCEIELNIVFKEGGTMEDTGEKWIAMVISCSQCGFESITDGTGHPPQWWLNEKE